MEQKAQLCKLRDLYFENYMERCEFQKMWKIFQKSKYAMIGKQIVSFDGSVFNEGGVVRDYFFASCMCGLNIELNELFGVS